MRFLGRVNLAAAERQVSSGCEVMKFFTRRVSRMTLIGGSGSLLGISRSGRSTEACKTP